MSRVTTHEVDARTERMREIVAAHASRRGPLLPILHDINAEFGHVPADAVALLAGELNLSRAEVHGVVTFYRDFRAAPPGARTVRICRAEACQAVGAGALVEHARARTGLSPGETAPDGSLTLDEVFCLGNCALGPAVQVDGRLAGRVTPERLDAILGADR